MWENKNFACHEDGKKHTQNHRKNKNIKKAGHVIVELIGKMVSVYD